MPQGLLTTQCYIKHLYVRSIAHIKHHAAFKHGIGIQEQCSQDHSPAKPAKKHLTEISYPHKCYGTSL